MPSEDPKNMKRFRVFIEDKHLGLPYIHSILVNAISEEWIRQYWDKICKNPSCEIMHISEVKPDGKSKISLSCM